MRIEPRRLAPVLPLAALALLLGCRSLVPIAVVRDAPLYVGDGATLDDVSDAIWMAATSLGWNLEREAPGAMKATLHLRSHLAVVRIEYDTRHFSILPVETQNIKREGDLIHPNYNGWIQNLERRIRATPVRPRTAAPPPPPPHAP